MWCGNKVWRAMVIVALICLLTSGLSYGQVPLLKSNDPSLTFGLTGSANEHASGMLGLVGGTASDRLDFSAVAGYLNVKPGGTSLVGGAAMSVYPLTGSMTDNRLYVSIDIGIMASGVTVKGGGDSFNSTSGSLGATLYSRLGSLPTSTALLGIGGVYTTQLGNGTGSEVAGVVSLVLGLYGGDNFLSIIPSVALSEETTTAGLTLTYTFMKKPKEPVF